MRKLLWLDQWRQDLDFMDPRVAQLRWLAKNVDLSTSPLLMIFQIIDRPLGVAITWKNRVVHGLYHPSVCDQRNAF